MRGRSKLRTGAVDHRVPEFSLSREARRCFKYIASSSGEEKLTTAAGMGFVKSDKIRPITKSPDFPIRSVSTVN